MLFRSAATAFLALSVTSAALAERPATRVGKLQELSRTLEAELEASRTATYFRILSSQAPADLVHRPEFGIELIRMSPSGRPMYYQTTNLTSAHTVATSPVWPGGASGLNLTGSGTLRGQLGIWDGGAVRVGHDEFTGRAFQEDGASSISNHATHVAGTMIAEGVDTDAQGMSYEARLSCHDWNNDESEAAAAAADTPAMRVSNHSYGFTTGWRFNSTDGNWYWYGDISVSDTEDFGFGRYDDVSQDWDQIAHDAPYYLICRSAGNDRNDFGPGPGGTHLVWDGGWVSSTDTRDIDGGPDGYDSISWTKTAKNILTVGAIDDIPSGYSQPSDVVMSTFSGWGPTDDGRIKPDLVTNGVQLYSSTGSANDAYSTASGTSMASPTAAGSANLVAGYYESIYSQDPTAALLKAILLHTTDEAGAADGPDYEHGWGLLNTQRAAEIVERSILEPDVLKDLSLADEGEEFFTFQTTTAGPYRLTMVWTDVPGNPVAPVVDDPTAMLVNDLDVRVKSGPSTVVGEPWILDPTNPSDPATQGDNFRDNVEQIYIANLPAGLYSVTINHKGTLSGGLSQNFSLVSSEPLLAPATDAPAIANSTLERPRVAPNPTSGETAVSFALAGRADVSVSIYDVRGRLVRTLARSVSLDAGAHRLTWDGRDENGHSVSGGVYLARVQAGSTSHSEKLVVLRDR